MSITYGRNLIRTLRAEEYRLNAQVLMKAYTTHTEQSEVFLSYRGPDRDTSLQLAAYLDRQGRYVFIDVHDGTLAPDVTDIDKALVTAIQRSETMVIVVSGQTQGSWWVPWEIGVSTPFGKPRAMYKPPAGKTLPDYLERLPRLPTPESVNEWVVSNQ